MQENIFNISLKLALNQYIPKTLNENYHYFGVKKSEIKKSNSTEIEV